MFALTLYIWLHNLRTKPSKQQEMGLANVKQLQNLHKMSVGNFQIICKRICFSKYYTWLCWCINMKTFWMEYSLLTPIWLILCLPPFQCSFFKCTLYKYGMCIYGTMIKFSLDTTWCYPLTDFSNVCRSNDLKECLFSLEQPLTLPMSTC